jgi:uncharacterized protein YjiS (DUF1127 family)
LRQRSSPAIPRLPAAGNERAFEPSRRAARFSALVGRLLDRLTEGVITWRERVRDRRRLAALDDRMLRDIGVDRGAVQQDSTASFWRLR